MVCGGDGGGCHEWLCHLYMMLISLLPFMMLCMLSLLSGVFHSVYDGFPGFRV